MVLNDVLTSERLDIGIVLEDGRLERRGSTTDASIEGLMRAFSLHDLEGIERFFNALIEHVKQKSGAFPADMSLADSTFGASAQ